MEQNQKGTEQQGQTSRPVAGSPQDVWDSEAEAVG